MRLSPTLLVYLGRQCLYGIGLALAVLLVLMFVVDVVELLRRSAGREQVGIDAVFAMALLKLPYMAFEVLPFATLFGGMYTFLRLSRTQELVVTRAAGVSVWQFLAPALFIAGAIGVFGITLFNPIASVMMAQYETLDAKLLRGRLNLLAVSSSGLWLRQADTSGHYVIHAENVSGEGTALADVIVFVYSDGDSFHSRIDARTARLTTGFWDLSDVIASSRDGTSERFPAYRLPTSMTPTQIQESFASPETMSFWALPNFIAMLETAGFSARKHLLHWHSLLSTPLLLCAMVLIAATFSIRITRRGGVGYLMVGGVLAGFLLYFLSDLTLALGISSALPVSLAAWAPAGVSSLLGLAMLFHLEDG